MQQKGLLVLIILSCATGTFNDPILLDGRLSWEKKGWKLYFDVMNMTDTRYFDFGGLEMPGVWFSGGIVVTIG